MNQTRRLAAYLVGINHTYLSKHEKGAIYPVLEIIAKLTTVLEVERRERIEAELA